MSGSYDRFSGRPPQPGPAQGQGQGQAYDPYDDAVTGAPTGPAGSLAGYAPAPPQASDPSYGAPPPDEPARDMYAPTRDTDRGRKMKTTAPVVPPGSVTGRSRTLVIAIKCFLDDLF